jgi:SpoVK/Ycf46/Vps4 family AAA+-type ATPase
MRRSRELQIHGIPQEIARLPAAAVCRSRLYKAIDELMTEAQLGEVLIRIATPDRLRAEVAPAPRSADRTTQPAVDRDDMPVEVRARRYQARDPLYEFHQLIVPDAVRQDLLAAVDLIRVEKKVFGDWGLSKIEPYPRTALNFHGEPGTGKTLAAHALARYSGRPILSASYGEIESKFHGDGPKNVEALFFAAERDGALLFIDEADSLLSRRLTDVTQGSEQAINSMRSQLLICLERFSGVVVFATNLVANYDRAFETRVRHIHFPLPDEACRREIWRRHLPAALPLSPGLSIDRLAGAADVCGRDIKNAVIDASVRVALSGEPCVDEADLLAAIDRIRSSRIKRDSPQGRKLTEEERAEVELKLRTARAG